MFDVRSGFFKGFREGSFRSLLKQWRIVLLDTSVSSGTDVLTSIDEKKVLLAKASVFFCSSLVSSFEGGTPFY